MILHKIISAGIAFLFVFVNQVSGFDTLKVDAILDTLNKEIYGYVSIQYPSIPGLASYQLQLFPNVYSGESSPYLKKGSALLEKFIKDKKWAKMEIDSVVISEDSINISSHLKVDYTMGVLDSLDRLLPAGKTFQVYFNTQIPEMGDRLSYSGNEYFLDGWFPRPALYDTMSGWYNPFYGSFCELVGDYFIFDLSLSVPSGYQIAGPVPSDYTENVGSMVKHHFRFGPAHDFGMAVSPRYLIDSMEVGQTIFRFYYRDYERFILPRVKSAAQKTFEYMAKNVGEYKYKYINYALVDFSFSGGLEMPAFMAISSPRDFPTFSRFYESVVIHETVHQWFYGMIGSNQIEYPWLDEATSNFFTEKIHISIWGEEANLFEFADFKVSNIDFLRMMSDIAGNDGIINRPAYSFVSTRDFFGLMYIKGALAIKTFDNLLEDSLSVIFWKSYYNRFLFAHPTPDDFWGLADKIGGEIASSDLQQLLNKSSRVDYSIEDLSNKRQDSVNIEIRLILRKTGLLESPIRYQIILANNDTLENVWKPVYNTEEIIITTSSPAIEAIIDPNYDFAIDADFLNNSLKVHGDNRSAARLTSGIIFLIESMLSLIGGM
jgi:hypothetical protein